MSKPLFEDFNPVSSKQWKQKIQVDLKGADYNDTLIWKTTEGIDVKPFYHADEFTKALQLSDTKSTTWKIGQNIDVLVAKEASKQALDVINRGAERISFTVKDESISIKDLLQNIETNKIPIHFNTAFLSVDFIKKVHLTALSTFKKSHITFNHDIIGHLAKTGNWYTNLKNDFASFDAVVKQTNQLYIDIGLYQNAGATIVQQLAYSLAQVNEYLNHLEHNNSNTLNKKLQVTFNVVVGTNYFFEIAKLKALRQLWSTLATTYNCNTNCKITANPSLRNKTIYDYNVNMLRTTTECMSAILGGADVITNLPYNKLFQEATEFGERISRNQLLILKKESYFNAVNNPTDGTYYIESLTEQLAEKALVLFKDIEQNGGILQQLKQGTIQRKIKESAAKEQAEFETGNIILLGTNRHPNTDDKMKDNLEKHPFLTKEKRKTLIEPIISKRLAEQLEIKRLKKE